MSDEATEGDIDSSVFGGNYRGMVIVKAFGIWFVLVLVAIGNGMARQALLAPRLSDRTAHQLSTLTGSILVLLVTGAFAPAFGVSSTRSLLGIGLFWLMLTVAFEFLFGHYVAGHSWQRLLADYNVLEGRVWPVILVVTFLAPLVAVRMRGL